VKEYRYNCVDKSILLSPFKQYYVRLFFKLVPPFLTANFITLFSTAFIIALYFPVQFLSDLNRSVLALIYAFSLHAYIVGDHLDGMQAKETGTGSPLGEFLDHYLDYFNGAVVWFVCFTFIGPLPPAIFFGFLWLNVVAFAATMMEQLERGELIFGPVGTLEGVILIILFFVTWPIQIVQDFWNAELISGYPRYWAVVFIVIFGYLATIFDIFKRLRYSPLQFNLLMVVGLLLAIGLIFREVDPIIGFWALSLYGAEYVAKIMNSYLLSKPTHKFPDWIGTVTILLGIPLSLIMDFQKGVFEQGIVILACYLALRTAWNFVQTCYELKKFWFWLNPR